MVCQEKIINKKTIKGYGFAAIFNIDTEHHVQSNLRVDKQQI